MGILGVMGLMALLFVLFGLVRPRTECTGHGCAACGLHCTRPPTSHEDHDHVA
ncbi:MAG: hypothetical protein HY275_13765 [Gemmatimonadetes bacterium]|nr:hypothetical protein [Gemmatimonadota bacterium]